MSFTFLQAKTFLNKESKNKDQQLKQAQLLVELSHELNNRNWMY